MPRRCIRAPKCRLTQRGKWPMLLRGRRCAGSPATSSRAACRIAGRPAPSSNFTKQGFLDAVLKAKEYIAAGDAFQIVPSQRFSVPFALPPFALYRALRQINPAPFLFFLDFGGFAVVGSGPILVRLRDSSVTVRRWPAPVDAVRRTRKTSAGSRTAGRTEGTCRTPDATRSRAQRRSSGGGNRVGEGDRKLRGRAVRPRDAYLVQRRRQAARGPGRARRAGRRLPSRRALRRAKSARDGDHRGTRTRSPRHLRRLHRLLRRQRHDGHLHRATHRGGEGRHEYVQAGGGVVADRIQNPNMRRPARRPAPYSCG